MKKKFNEILHNYGIEIGMDNPVEILHAMEEVFEYTAKKIKEIYPYATNAIDDYEAAARATRDLAYEIERE